MHHVSKSFLLTFHVCLVLILLLQCFNSHSNTKNMMPASDIIFYSQTCFLFEFFAKNVAFSCDSIRLYHDMSKTWVCNWFANSFTCWLCPKPWEICVFVQEPFINTHFLLWTNGNTRWVLQVIYNLRDVPGSVKNKTDNSGCRSRALVLAEIYYSKI